MKKIILNLFIIGIASAAVIGSAFAYFDSKKTNKGSTFANSILDLQIMDQDDSWENQVTATWVMDNMKPGDVSSMNSIYLRNVSDDIEADYVNITVVSVTADPHNEESDTDYPTVGDLDKWMEIAAMYYHGSSILADLSDSNGNGWIDLDDFANQGLNNLTPAPAVNAGNMTIFTMQVKFREEAGNNFQGDSLESEFAFSLIQE